MSLADALAVSVCARNVVLLGDPLQLAQVSQGTHPLGTNALRARTLARRTRDDSAGRRGLSRSLLPHGTRDLRLHLARGLRGPSPRRARLCIATQSIRRSHAETGCSLLPSRTKATRAVPTRRLLLLRGRSRQLLRGLVRLGESSPRALRSSDVIVVAPYNAQRKRIRRHLAAAGLEGIAVGTVDKFQGQEAAIVFYSMATSSGATHAARPRVSL